ncbi:MAG: molybdopterin-dependent oxidoreductase [Granulosicoccus sp.]
MFPPGQKPRADFPRFGLTPYANRFPSRLSNQIIDVIVDGQEKFEVDVASKNLERTSKQADFHCVTTWTYADARWSGVRFSEFFDKYIKNLENPKKPIVGVVVYAQDGYKTSLLLEDLLNSSAMLADKLNDTPLSIEHGAPLRLVVPEHYGYKNLKHLETIEFHTEMPVIKRGLNAFLDHPRARVRLEERGRWIPGWILRYVYRPFIPSTIKEFSDAMRNYIDVRR